MRRHSAWRVAAAALFAMLGGCASAPGGWTTLIDGSNGLDNFTRVGDANWSAADGVVQATRGGKDASYLVTKSSYRDFVIRVEFWASDDANSGVFLRCSSRTTLSSENCYEANIFDQRPDPSYGTGAIVGVSKVNPMPRAGGKWNTFEITAKGPQLTLVMNGVVTADARDGKLAEGPIGLQWGQGTIKFRNVEIRPL